MEAYFYKREYLFLYLSKFCYTFANSFIDIFGAIMLYKNGMSIAEILFLYGIRFGLMGLLSPLFITISSRIGIASCALLANILRIIGSYMILNTADSNIFIFIIVMSIPGALSNPIEDAVSSKYVNTQNRGRYNSAKNIARVVGQVLASCLVGWGVLSANNHVLLFVISIFFILDYLFIAIIDYKPIKSNKNVFRETFHYLVRRKSNYKIIYSLLTNHIIERLFVPLYLFLVLEDFKVFTIITVVSLIVQMITIFVIGKYADSNIYKSTHLVTVIKLVITSIYLFPMNKIFIAINKIISDNFEKAYEIPIRTSIQNIIKNSDEDESILATVGQMSLCFTEIIIFSILSLLSLFMHEKVFILIFIFSMLSTIIINIKIKNFTAD